MVKKHRYGRINFLLALLLLSFIIVSCDKELLEPAGNRRLKRIVDMDGFVKEEWNYNKKGQLKSIRSFIRAPFFYYTEDEDSDGIKEIKYDTLNDNPRILTYAYENDKLKEVVEVDIGSHCGCGRSGSTSVHKISYLNDRLNQIKTTIDYGYAISEEVLEVTYSPDQAIIKITKADSEHLLYYDEEKNNIIKKEEYFQGELKNLQHYTYDDKVNPFYQKYKGFLMYSLEYWNKNNLLTIRETNHYSGVMYHYYGDYPLSSRLWSPFIDIEDWSFFYEYE